MRKVHEKSIFLGIGIGMIITAIVGMIFSAGSPKELSKAEIISLAKGYGLIVQPKLINEESSDSTDSASESTTAKNTTADSTASLSTIASDSSSNNTERNIVIEIKKGYNSQDVIDTLLEKAVITSGEDFSAVLNSYNASKIILVGNYKFKKNEDMNYIVRTICNLK